MNGSASTYDSPLCSRSKPTVSMIATSEGISGMIARPVSKALRGVAAQLPEPLRRLDRLPADIGPHRCGDEQRDQRVLDDLPRRAVVAGAAEVHLAADEAGDPEGDAGEDAFILGGAG
jgi:hypothetical protein